jgi:hypothetical protein
MSTIILDDCTEQEPTKDQRLLMAKWYDKALESNHVGVRMYPYHEGSILDRLLKTISVANL